MTALRPLRLYHTLRPLRRGQLLAQVTFRMRRLLEDPERAARRSGPAGPVRWSPRAMPAPGGAAFDGDALRAGRFGFLGREVALGWPPDWEASGVGPLWRYNLHYFEYLWALEHADAAALALDWIERHTLARGRVGWESYPTSLRAMNWCAYFFGEHRGETERNAPLRDALGGSIALQTDWLADHVEHHLLGNHLFENAAALAFVGSCFGGARADAWLAQGRALLERELPEQILPDGGHFERSPMYQVRTALVLRWLTATQHPALSELVAAPLQRTLDALGRLRHPDGEIALLNDSAIGVANPPGDLLDGASSAGGFALSDTGYYGARTASGHYLVCDAAPVGPDYQPGHAHGDLLSFELSLRGRRVVVDAGVHGYDGDPWRAWCRSTRAHNTVEIDGESQCEFWGTFRVARRARPREVRHRTHPDGFELEAWHDGYERLAARAQHRRRFRWYDSGVLLVRDTVTARRSVEARSRLHLHPDCELLRIDGPVAHVRHPGGVFRVCAAGVGDIAVEDSRYCPAFGRSFETLALTLATRGSTLEFGYCIAEGEGSVGYDLAAGATLADRRFSW